MSNDPLIDIGGMFVRASRVLFARVYLGRYVLVGVAGMQPVRVKVDSADDAELLVNHIVRECNSCA